MSTLPTAKRLKCDAEQRAHKRQLEELYDDSKRLCAVDITTPFRTLKDAVERLLPYHLLGGADPEEADAEEFAEFDGAEYVVSRHETWAQQALNASTSGSRFIEQVRSKIDALEAKEGGLNKQARAAQASTAGGWGAVESSTPQEVPRMPEERLLIEKVLVQDAREALEREKRRPSGYMTPDEDEAMHELGSPTSDALGQRAEGPTTSGLPQSPGAAGLGDEVAGLQEPATAAGEHVEEVEEVEEAGASEEEVVGSEDVEEGNVGEGEEEEQEEGEGEEGLGEGEEEEDDEEEDEEGAVDGQEISDQEGVEDEEGERALDEGAYGEGELEGDLEMEGVEYGEGEVEQDADADVQDGDDFVEEDVSLSEEDD